MRVTRHCSGVAGALLVTFHGWLLASQFLDGQLAEPWMALRWIVAAVLVATLVVIRRQGAEVFSRQTVAVWALAALLHEPAVVDRYGEALHGAALPESVSTVVRQIVSASTTLVLTLWLLGAPLARRDERPMRFTHSALTPHPAGALAGGFSPPFSPRPPPAA